MQCLKCVTRKQVQASQDCRQRVKLFFCRVSLDKCHSTAWSSKPCSWKVWGLINGKSVAFCLCSGRELLLEEYVVAHWQTGWQSMAIAGELELPRLALLLHVVLPMHFIRCARTCSTHADQNIPWNTSASSILQMMADKAKLWIKVFQHVGKEDIWLHHQQELHESDLVVQKLEKFDSTPSWYPRQASKATAIPVQMQHCLRAPGFINCNILQAVSVMDLSHITNSDSMWQWIPRDPAHFGAYMGVAFAFGVTASWVQPACTAPIIAETIALNKRSCAYAMDRCLEAALGAFSPLVLGTLIQKLGWKVIVNPQAIPSDAHCLWYLITTVFKFSWQLCTLIPKPL